MSTCKTNGAFFKKEFTKLRKNMIKNLKYFIFFHDLNTKQQLLMTRGVALFNDPEADFIPYIEGVLKSGKVSVMVSEYGEPEVWNLSQVTNEQLAAILIEFDTKKFTIEEYEYKSV